MKIIFFGTSEFAVPSLQALLKNGYEIPLVVTQADQPKGRGQKMSAPAVKIAADESGLFSIQPEIIREQSFYDSLKSFQCDIIVVVSYGKILPKEILEIPPRGCINVHASLLPLYRGAAPIQWSILNGEKVTGVTTMYMNEKMDEGDVLLHEKVTLDGSEIAPQLSEQLSTIGASLLITTLRMIQENAIEGTSQDSSAATYAPKIKKEHGLIDWKQSAYHIDRMVRAFQPWPSAYSYYHNKLIKIWESEALADDLGSSYPPSAISQVEKNAIHVKCGFNTILKIKKLQIEGKGIVTAKSFLAGHQVKPGELLEQG